MKNLLTHFRCRLIMPLCMTILLSLSLSLSLSLFRSLSLPPSTTSSLCTDLFYPLAIFSSNVTYHSATLQWATAHVDSSFNHTFIISYTNASTNSLSFNSTKVVKIQYGPIGDLYSAVLPGLTPNATFQTNVISSSLFYREKIFEGPTITTLSYRKYVVL